MRITWEHSCDADYVFALIKPLERVCKKRKRRLIIRGLGRGLDILEGPLLEQKP